MYNEKVLDQTPQNCVLHSRDEGMSYVITCVTAKINNKIIFKLKKII